jgi:hypothetical protein
MLLSTFIYKFYDLRWLLLVEDGDNFISVLKILNIIWRPLWVGNLLDTQRTVTLFLLFAFGTPHKC